MYQPHFTLNYAMIKAIAKAEAANALAFSSLVPITWQRKWANKAMPWSVSANLGLDGNPLTFQQIEKIVVREPARDDHAPYIAMQVGVEAASEQVQEVINYLHTLKHVHEQASERKQPEYDLKLLLDLHALATERAVPLIQVGVWRNVKLAIKQDTGGATVFQPPTPIELKYQLDDFASWLNSPLARELPVLIKAGICWAELSRLYPFAIANGRVTRAFIRLVLGSEGIRLATVLPYEQYFLENRAGYYQSLLRSITQRDLSPWLEFYLEAWGVQAEGFLDQINSKEIKSTANAIHQPVPLREREIKILDYLRQSGWVSIPQLNEVFSEVSEDSILRDLRDLMKKTLVKKKGKTKAARYALRGGAW